MPRQYTLDFEPGLTERFKTFDEVLAAAVYGCRKDWLIEKYLRDPEAMKQEALARLPALMEAIQATLEQARGPAAAKGAR